MQLARGARVRKNKEMSKYLKGLKCVHPNINEIYVSIALGVFGLFLSSAAIPIPFEFLAISVILCLVASCCAINAIADEGMGMVGRTLSLTWLTLHILFSIAQMVSFPEGPRA